MNTIAILAATLFSAAVADVYHPPQGFDLHHRHGSQHIERDEAMMNGFREDPYSDGIWSDCPCSSGFCDSSSDSSCSSSSSSCDSSSSSCDSSSSCESSSIIVPTTTTSKVAPTVTSTSVNIPPLVCTTVVLCYPGAENPECDADQAQLVSQIQSLISQNMAAQGKTATKITNFNYATSGAKVIAQNDAPAGSFVGTLTSVAAFVIAAAMILA